MPYSNEDIEKAISILDKKIGSRITRHFEGYIILAQNEKDFISKSNKILRGDTRGFYKVTDFQ